MNYLCFTFHSLGIIFHSDMKIFITAALNVIYTHQQFHSTPLQPHNTACTMHVWNIKGVRLRRLIV